MFRLEVKGKDKLKVIEEKHGTEVGKDEVIMMERGGGNENCNNRIGKSTEENGRN